MFENWVWTSEGLSELLSLGGGKALPSESIKNLVHSRTANAGLFYSRQLMLADFDQAIHTAPEHLRVVLFNFYYIDGSSLGVGSVFLGEF
ncbi:unnamed protein product [Protopolystoma xenopodis]|uniref:Peptidase M3A/M3B catalytic domain-containing protein n=1 Tax=Protopolystoma xenopodis TaxID=117903 RepID=A0A3S5CK93_9PLAT|nr:unnamed protein product [Protopolystoma xenopodis]